MVRFLVSEEYAAATSRLPRGLKFDPLVGCGNTLHPTPDTRHPARFTLHPISYTLHPAPYTLLPIPYTLHLTPYTLQPNYDGPPIERLEVRLHLGRKVDVRLPGKGNSNSHGARPVHQIITTIKWIRTSRLSIKNSLSARRGLNRELRQLSRGAATSRLLSPPATNPHVNINVGSVGLDVRLIDCCTLTSRSTSMTRLHDLA